MTMCADDEAYSSREPKPFNEQAAILIETALDLIKQVLVKHSAAVLEEMHDQVVQRNKRISELEREIPLYDEIRKESRDRLGSINTLESECNQLNDMTIKQRAIIDDLAAMCRRLSYSVKRAGNDQLAHQCVQLLKKYDLGGSVLRTDAKPPAVLDVIADRVLAFRPRPKSKPAKKRARRRKKIQRDSCI